MAPFLWMLIAALILGLLIWAAQRGAGQGALAPTAAPAQGPAAAPAQGPAQEATYRITFSTPWGGANSPAAAPRDAHTGNMLLLAHSGRFHLYAAGALASDGIVETAMHGTLGGLDRIVAAAQAQGSVGAAAKAPPIAAPGSQQLELRVDAAHPYAAFVAMLAPSPDWFFGIDSVPLYSRANSWVPRVEVPISVWDAGSDRGTAFANEPDYAEPVRKPIALVTEPLFRGGPRPLATLTFERVA